MSDPIPTRERVLSTLAAALRPVAEANAAQFHRNHPSAVDEGMRPAVLLFDGDEELPLVPGKMGYGPTWAATAQPVVVVQVDGPAADVGPLLNLWHARLMRAVYTNVALLGLKRGGGGNHIQQQALVTGLRPDKTGAVGSLHWHLGIEYPLDPTNPYS